MKTLTNRPRASQADIAQALGVSISTVSRALSDSPSITEPIRRKVRDCALQIGYPIKQRQTVESFESIVVISAIEDFNDVRSSIYYETLSGIREEAHKVSGSVETFMTQSRTPLPAEISNRLNPRTGCIFLGLTPAPETLADFAERGISSVIANGIDEELRVDAITPTNFLGGAVIGRYLMGMGHRRFLYMGGRNRLTLQRRFAGFRQHVEGGADAADGKVVSVFGHTSRRPVEPDLKEFQAWVTTHLHDATALFCYNDSAAVWAIEAMRMIGISIPDEMSVAGFDDMPIAKLASPALTTFRINWVDVGEEAVQTLHRRMVSPESAVRLIQLGGQLVPRDSVAKL